MKIKFCRNCNSKKLKSIFSLGNLYFTGKFLKKNLNPKKGPINVIICKKCGLVQLENNFNLNYLYGPNYGYRTGINATMTNHVKKVVTLLSKRTKLKKNDLVLDIGSNDGTLLNFYNSNIITFGIDPLIIKFKKYYKKINFKISNFFSYKLIQQKKLKKKFKIITALSVFYDSLDPNKFLKDVEMLLDNDGIFLLEFADLASIIKQNMFDTFCHEHLEYYSLNVIKQMCKKNKLRIFDIKYNNINGGSVQIFICKTKSKFKINIKKLNEVYKHEKKMKLTKEDTFKFFINKINRLRNKLYNFLKQSIEEGKKIHAYGASTKGNVLMQYFKINSSLISYVADRNPKKYNLFTPGTKIKIISEKLSRAMKPDYYLVLPWHFKKEIMKRENLTVKKGSKFIFPLPNFKIF